MGGGGQQPTLIGPVQQPGQPMQQPGQNPYVDYARPGQPIPPGQIDPGYMPPAMMNPNTNFGSATSPLQPGQNPLVNYSNPGLPVGQDPTAIGFPPTMMGPQPMFPMQQPSPYNGPYPLRQQPGRQQPGSNLMDAIRNAGGRQPMNPNLIPQPQQPQRGLGGLQIDKFKSRLNQR